MNLLMDVLWSGGVAFILFWLSVVVSIIYIGAVSDSKLDSKEFKDLFKIAITSLKIMSMVAGAALYLLLFK